MEGGDHRSFARGGEGVVEVGAAVLTVVDRWRRKGDLSFCDFWLFMFLKFSKRLLLFFSKNEF